MPSADPLLCSKCREDILPSEAYMRAPDLRAYHLACYDSRAARPWPGRARRAAPRRVGSL